MILIGQYDSSYTRRVAIPLTFYGIAFTHEPWSTFGDVEKLRKVNPLIRVPALVLESGEVLIETLCILDYVDSLVPQDQRLFPVAQPERYRAMKIAALAAGFMEKAGAFYFERIYHNPVADAWATRCREQVTSTLGELDKDCARRTTPYWFGDRIGHADIAVATSYRHASEAVPDLVPASRYPALAAFAARLEDLPAFRANAQPFVSSAEIALKQG